MIHDLFSENNNQKFECPQCGQFVYELTVFDKEKFIKEVEICWLHMSCWPCKYKKFDEVKNEKV